MKVRKIDINRGWSGENPLEGTVEFTSEDKTELKIRLDDELCREVVQLCAKAIARAGKNAADMLVSDLLATTAIEHQPDER